jgi:DNA-binding MarR family transcriptional regulator
MAGHSEDRLQNLLAALAVGLVDDVTSTSEHATGALASATPALIALSQFLNQCNVGKLADVLGLSHSGAVRLVGQLEAAGYVRRTHLADRRQVNVVLTRAGRRAARSAAAARRRVAADLLAGLTPAERQELEPLVAKLVERVAAVRAHNRSQHGIGSGWLCRSCDFAACGRPEGRCPAANAAAAVVNQ